MIKYPLAVLLDAAINREMITNQNVAKLAGCTGESVSRHRRGLQAPSLHVRRFYRDHFELDAAMIWGKS